MDSFCEHLVGTGLIWYNNHGLVHREDGPAIERFDGTNQWWLRGRLHREDGPAIEYYDGRKSWYIHGELIE